MAVEGDLLRRLAHSSGLRPTEVRYFIQVGVITLTDQGVPPAMIRRLRRARRLRRDLGLSVDAIAIILRLVERVEALEGTHPRGLVARVIDDQ
jgi:MerR-like DNA binding protein